MPGAIAGAAVFLAVEPGGFKIANLGLVLVAALVAAVATTLLRFTGNLIAEPYRTLRKEIQVLVKKVDDLQKLIGDCSQPAPLNKEERQRKRLNRLREFVLDFDWDEKQIIDTPEWSEIRSIIDADVVEKMEAGIQLEPVLSIGRAKTDKMILLDELAELERRWNLI